MLEASAQGLKIELDSLENLGIRIEGLNRAGLIGGLAATQGTVGHATVGEGDVPRVALAVHLGNHAGR